MNTNVKMQRTLVVAAIAALSLFLIWALRLPLGEIVVVVFVGAMLAFTYFAFTIGKPRKHPKRRTGEEASPE